MILIKIKMKLRSKIREKERERLHFLFNKKWLVLKLFNLVKIIQLQKYFSGNFSMNDGKFFFFLISKLDYIDIFFFFFFFLKVVVVLPLSTTTPFPPFL